MKIVRPSLYLKNLSILYVEDKDDIREALSAMIKRHVKHFIVASNGQNALEKLENNHIDIIISDIKMPIMDGLEMLQKIRERGIDILVLFMTAFSNNEYLMKAIDLNTDGYITKPINRNTLFSKLNTFANNLKYKKESQEYFQLIITLLNEQESALILLEKENIKITNLAFKKLVNYKDIKSIDDLKDTFKERKDCIDFEEFTEHLKNNNLHNQIICVDLNNKEKFYQITSKIVAEHTLISFSDITLYKVQNENLFKENFQDKLTGLYNRKILDITLDKISQNNENICIIFFDIDDFKKINDTFGHKKGDEVLAAISKTLKETLRENDMVIRWGGEEFLVIVKHLKSIKMSLLLAQKIRENIKNIDMDNLCHITCSFGVGCSIINKRDDFYKLLQDTDKALYKAKRLGKDRVMEVQQKKPTQT